MTLQAVNPTMITLARELHGLTQKELGLQLKTNQGTISKIEMGLKSVTKDMLKKIAYRLNFPESFFLQEGALFRPNLYYRKKYRVSKKVLLKAEAEMNLYRLSIEKLLKSVEIDSPELPIFDVDNDGEPQTIAKKLREYWSIPKGPIKNTFYLVESKGVVIIPISFDGDSISGASMLTSDKTPIIFINKNNPIDRQRFTLMHELFHVIAHIFNSIPEKRDVDREADLFASEFLMPEKDIRQHFLGRLTINKLADLKRFWGVSMAALLMRAKQLGAESERHIKTLWIEMGKLGFRKQEPIELNPEREIPRLLKNLIIVHKEELDYSDEDISKMLNLQKKFTIEKFYEPEKTKLKISANGMRLSQN